MKASNQINSGWTGELTTSIVPTHYNLTLRPDIDSLTFTGYLEITLNVIEPTSIITLGAERLDVYDVRLRDDSQATPFYYIKNNPSEEFATFFLSKEVAAHKSVFLSMYFNGSIETEYDDGFYLKYSETEFSVEPLLIYTAISMQNVRKVFPCWNDSQSLVSFDFQIEVEKNLTVLSNMDINSEKKVENSKKLVQFRTTPKITFDDFAFVVGNLEKIENYTRGYEGGPKVRNRIYTLPGYSEFANFSLNSIVDSLDSFENEFNFTYPINKLDFLAVPDYFTGATSFFGLILFRQDHLITDNLSHFDDDKIYSVYAIAHEISHQWFGNSLPNKLSSDIWLNEGFASYFGLITSHKLYPEYNIIGRFGIKRLVNLWKQDITSPISSVNHPITHSRSFGIYSSDIFYYKGAFVLSMLNHTLGSILFMKNVREYINKYQHQYVTTNIFYESMLKNTELDMFKNWIEKPGYPVLELSEMNKCNSNSTTLHLKQSRFVQKDNTTWYLKPDIKSFAPYYKSKSFVFDSKSNAIVIPKNHGYIINSGFLSYYHVQYPIVNLERLFNSNLSSTEIIRLCLDTKNLLDQGAIPNINLLPVINLYKQINDPLVWKQFISMFNSYFNNWANFPRVKKQLLRLKKRIYYHLFKIYGINFQDSDSDLINHVRSEAIINVAQFDKSIIDNFGHIFNKTTKSPSTHPDFIETMIKTVLKSSNPFYYKTFITVYNVHASVEEKFRFIQVLVHINPTHLKKVLQWALHQEDSNWTLYYLLNFMQPQFESHLVCWEFIKENWVKIEEIIAKNEAQVDIIQKFVSQLIQPKLFDEISEFINNKSPVRVSFSNPYYVLQNQENEMLNYLDKHNY